MSRKTTRRIGLIAAFTAVAAAVFGIQSENPVNPNATVEARNVLRYLRSPKGKGWLAGQEENNFSTSSQLSKVERITGKRPALRGFDFRPDSVDPVDEIIRWRKQGGLGTLSWRMGAPPREDTYKNSRGRADISRVLEPGTIEYKSFIANLDGVARRLQKFQDAGVPVLWRPWHEMNGSRFWWSKGGPEQFHRLWIFMYDYYTREKGLNNLMRVWSASYTSDARWYPGDRYVDVVGSDVYASARKNVGWPTIFGGLKRIAPSRIAALTENDLIPDPDWLKAAGAKPVWFLTWHSQWLDRNTAAHLEYIYDHPFTITFDELPDI